MFHLGRFDDNSHQVAASKTDLYTIYSSDRTKYSYRDQISDLYTEICIEIGYKYELVQIRSLLQIFIRSDEIQVQRSDEIMPEYITNLHTIYSSDWTKYIYRDRISNLCTKICVEIGLNSVIMQIQSLLLITIRSDGIQVQRSDIQ